MKTLLSLLVFVTGCHAIPPSPPVPDSSDCDRAYEHLGAVGCEPSKPESGTWIDVCKNARRNGLMPLTCINAARTFEAADLCGVNCAPK